MHAPVSSFLSAAAAGSAAATAFFTAAVAVARFTVKATLHEVPIDELVKEGLDVGRTGVAVIDVVGVFPNVDDHQGLEMFRQRRAGVGGRIDFKLAVQALDEPRPAGAEVVGRLGREVCNEAFVRTPLLDDGVHQCAGRFAAAVGAQALPIEGVVVALRSVIEDRALACLDDFTQGFGFVHRAFDEIVEIGDVGLMMLAVVVFQRFLADGRCKGVHFIIKLGQNELAHWTSPRESVIDRISLLAGRVSSKIAFLWEAGRIGHDPLLSHETSFVTLR